MLGWAYVNGQWNWVGPTRHKGPTRDRSRGSGLFCSRILCMGSIDRQLGSNWLWGEEYVHGRLRLENFFPKYRGITFLILYLWNESKVYQKEFDLWEEKSLLWNFLQRNPFTEKKLQKWSGLLVFAKWVSILLMEFKSEHSF